MTNQKRVAMVLTAATLLSASACRSDGGASPTRAGDGTKLVELNDVKVLQAQFNKDEGTPRLLLVLSPT